NKKTTKRQQKDNKKTTKNTQIYKMETYFGFVKSPQDAILLFEACRIGFLSRIQRRLSEKERSSIRSGSVFVWDEREAGMRRWTDGKSWSASRVSGSFLTYRELESKRKSNSRGSNNPHDLSSEDTDSSESYHSVTKKSMSATEQCRYKHGGLVKQSFSITTTSHQKLHLICYYTKADVINEKLQIPSHDEKLKNDFPNFFGRHNYLQHHASGSTSSLPVYPPSNYIQSPSDNPFGNGSQPINIPNPNSRFTFPAPQLPYSASYPPQSSQANGFQLPPQDIPQEKMIDRNNEDQRQLKAIYTTLRL
ncbi:7321_t:CDS:2, partial [Gigaspora rosea]